MSSGVAASPYLWSALGGLFCGVALGQLLRWLLAATLRWRRVQVTEARDAFDRGCPARACVAASLAILALAALLVFPPKEALHGPLLLEWAMLLAICGALAGIWPRVGGGACLLVLAAFVLILRASIAGWLPAQSGSAIARLLPFDMHPAAGAPATAAPGSGPAPGTAYRGELRELHGAVAGPARRLDLPVSEAALVVETVTLRGPLAFVAAFPSSLAELRLYRVVGLSGPDTQPLLFSSSALPLERIVHLDGRAGFVPGGTPARAGALFGLLLRTRAASEDPKLEALQPVLYSLDENLAPHVLPPPGDALGVLAR